MNREDIIRMAREAWLSDKEAQLITEFDEAYISCTYLQDLEKFAALVASSERESLRESFRVVTAAEASAAILHEREACAKVADTISDKYGWGHYGNEVDTADEIAAAIRARGQA